MRGGRGRRRHAVEVEQGDAPARNDRGLGRVGTVGAPVAGRRDPCQQTVVTDRQVRPAAAVDVVGAIGLTDRARGVRRGGRGRAADDVVVLGTAQHQVGALATLDVVGRRRHRPRWSCPPWPSSRSLSGAAGDRVRA